MQMSSITNGVKIEMRPGTEYLVSGAGGASLPLQKLGSGVLRVKGSASEVLEWLRYLERALDGLATGWGYDDLGSARIAPGFLQYKAPEASTDTGETVRLSFVAESSIQAFQTHGEITVKIRLLDLEGNLTETTGTIIDLLDEIDKARDIIEATCPGGEA